MDPEIINEPGIPNQPDLPEHGDFQMPPLEELLKALEGMDGLSEENKQELRESLISRANQENPDFFANHVETAKNAGMAPDLLVLFLLLAIVVLIFGKQLKFFFLKSSSFVFIIINTVLADFSYLLYVYPYHIGYTYTFLHYKDLNSNAYFLY
jgi:hypothetical protein